MKKAQKDLRIHFHFLLCANSTKAEKVGKRKLSTVSWELVRILDMVFRGRQKGSEVSFSGPPDWGT